MPDYHLILDYPFPAVYEDSMLAYADMVKHAEELGIHLEKIIVLGDSGGTCSKFMQYGTVKSSANAMLPGFDLFGD